ncbi:MAG: SRPBCC family protein [Planctomycetaceae bacterium]
MVKKILIAVAAIVLVFLGVVAMQPGEFHIARSAKMAAPPERVFAQVNDFHNWGAWSPWIKLDPNAKTSFEGPSSGLGAVFKWAGNSEVGVGGMTIVESQPADSIRIRLDFKEPFEDTSTADFTFRPAGAETEVTWSMSGRNNFVGKAMCLFMNMDQMIGEKFEEGLASLKSVVEAPAAESESES